MDSGEVWLWAFTACALLIFTVSSQNIFGVDLETHKNAEEPFSHTLGSKEEPPQSFILEIMHMCNLFCALFFYEKYRTKKKEFRGKHRKTDEMF